MTHSQSKTKNELATHLFYFTLKNNYDWLKNVLKFCRFLTTRNKINYKRMCSNGLCATCLWEAKIEA